MIEIISLEMYNFMSHKDTILRFSDCEGLVLVEGKNTSGYYSSNGSGKSTLLEGIIYSLTGTTLRGVGVNDVVNRNYNKNTRVTLKFLKDKTMYEISRYRKDEKFGDSIVFIREGEDISKRVNKETQQLIDDTLGISLKVLVSTVLLGEGLSSKFTQLSDPEKKSLIESTLNLNYDMNDLRAKANSNLSSLKLEKSNLEGQISALEGYVDYDISTAQEEISSLEESHKEKMSLIEEKNSKINEINVHLNQLVDKTNLIKSSIDKVDRLTYNIENLNTENARLSKELHDVEVCANPRCTVCNQELGSSDSKEAFKLSYSKSIEDISKKILENREQLDTLPEKSILETTYNKFSGDISELRTGVVDLTQESQQIQGEAYQLHTRLSTLKSDIQNYEKATQTIDNLKESNESVTSQSEIYDYFYKLFSPTGIIVDILSDAVGYINERISTYSEVLLDKRYKVEFLKGKISLIDESKSSYQSLSNGERKRLDLAIQFALHDYVVKYCGQSFNVMFIDEVMDALDDTGTSNIIEVLRLKLDYCSLNSIIVITHNDELKSYFDSIITVSKNEKGDSTIL